MASVAALHEGVTEVLTASTHNIVTLPDGRRLGFGDFGDADGAPLFFFHGGLCL